jgi:hypothetical protein
MRGVLSVDEMQGERWDLAVERLERGDGIIAVASLLLYRDANGPAADGHLHVEIVASWRSNQLTQGRARADVEAGLVRLDQILADVRMAQLARTHDLVREYVEDYETGRVRLATIEDDGRITWVGNPPPP